MTAFLYGDEKLSVKVITTYLKTNNSRVTNAAITSKVLQTELENAKKTDDISFVGRYIYLLSFGLNGHPESIDIVYDIVMDCLGLVDNTSAYSMFEEMLTKKNYKEVQKYFDSNNFVGRVVDKVNEWHQNRTKENEIKVMNQYKLLSLCVSNKILSNIGRIPTIIQFALKNLDHEYMCVLNEQWKFINNIVSSDNVSNFSSIVLDAINVVLSIEEKIHEYHVYAIKFLTAVFSLDIKIPEQIDMIPLIDALSKAFSSFPNHGFALEAISTFFNQSLEIMSLRKLLILRFLPTILDCAERPNNRVQCAFCFRIGKQIEEACVEDSNINEDIADQDTFLELYETKIYPSSQIMNKDYGIMRAVPRKLGSCIGDDSDEEECVSSPVADM